MIDGYEKHEADGEVCCVWLANEVVAFLETEAVNDRSNVRHIGRILTKVAVLGQTKLGSVEQFRHEGKFSGGIAGGQREAVFAVKAHQLRVYGGFLSIRGTPCFFGIEATRKRRDKADNAQLVRVANALGSIRNGN